jgi:transcriptional regulator with XRE-family HTH domain
MGELGSLLTRAREARGLTLEDAERDTRISRRYLQALESEQFEVIPAPVYARGFLRSYSQYLGLDPQETLAMFPREDDPEYQRAADATAAPPRPSPDRPVSPVSASRPTWRSTPAPTSQQPGQRPTGQRPAPSGRPTPMQPRRQEPAANYEPVIGVDIGVSSPARRIKTDPAAQTRSMVIAIVAIAAVIGVVLLAYIISSLGGDDTTPGGTANDDSTDQTTTAGDDTTPASGDDQPSGLDVTPGIVPDLIGVQEDVARRAIAEAGYVVSEFREPNSQPKGTVINQSPAPDVEYAAGSTVRIVISEGP